MVKFWGFNLEKKGAKKVPDEILSKTPQKEDTPEESLKREQVKKELEFLRKEFEDTKAILDTTSSRLDAIRNEYYSKSSEMDSLDSELQRKKSEVRAINLDYVKLKSEFDRLNSELSLIRSEYNPRILESTRQEIEMARSELAKLNYQAEDAKILVGDFQSKIDSAKSELGNIKSRIESERSELEMIKAQNESTKKEIDVAKREFEFIQKELASPVQIDQIRKISQAASAVVAQANKKSEDLEKNIRILRESLSKTLEENQKLQERLAAPETVKKISDIKNELFLLQSQQEMKKKELGQTKMELEFIQKELAATYETRKMVSTIETNEWQSSSNIIKNDLSKTKLKQKILLQPIGSIPSNLLSELQERLSQQFNNLNFEITSKELSLPTNFIDWSRNQFKSLDVIEWLEKNCVESGYDKILGICNADAYSGELNFVMGEAQLDGLIGLVYMKIFRTEIEQTEKGLELFLQRLQKETAHELGHLFGLEHCVRPTCVMNFSNSLADTDLKDIQMCQSCTKKLINIIA